MYHLTSVQSLICLANPYHVLETATGVFVLELSIFYTFASKQLHRDFPNDCICMQRRDGYGSSSLDGCYRPMLVNRQNNNSSNVSLSLIHVSTHSFRCKPCTLRSNTMLCQISSRLEHTEKITGDNCFDAYRTTPLHISRSNSLKGQRAHLSHSKRSNWRENADRIFSFWTISLATTRHEFRVLA